MPAIDPFEEGRAAYLDDVPLSDCPYNDGSTEQVEWEGGWMEAEEEYFEEI